MVNTPYPLPRQTRESDVLVGNGSAGPYGPSQYKIFDIEDVTVWTRPAGALSFSDVSAGCTITKTSNAQYDTFSVTFWEPIPASTEWYHSAKRVSARSLAVTRAGSLDAPQLEQELSKQASSLSELRRDVDAVPRFRIGPDFDPIIEARPNEFLGLNTTGDKIIGKGTPGELGAGDMLGSNNLLDVADAAEAMDNLGVPAAIATEIAALDNVKRDDLTSPTLAMPAIHIKSRLHDIFSVMEVFDNDTQRDEIRNRASALDAGPYINAATDYATRRGYNTVHFPFGTYLLKGARNGNYSRALLIARSGLTLAGVYGKSVIKVDNGVTNAADTTMIGSIPTSDYRIIAPAANDLAAFLAASVDDFTIDGLRFDGNGANNTVVSSSGGNVRRAYMASFGKGNRIKIVRSIFENCPGRNVLQFGVNQADSFNDCDIIGNDFYNSGDAITGNSGQNDHSTLYTQFNSGRVLNNRLKNPSILDPTTVNNCALEIHGSRTLVQGNYVENYRNGGNVVGLDEIGGSTGNRWIGNSFKVSNVGLAIWTFNAAGAWSGSYFHNDLHIVDNLIEIDNGLDNATYYGIQQHADASKTKAPFEDSIIARNIIRFSKTTPSTNLSHGIGLTTLKSVRVTDNKIYNAAGDGVLVSEAADTTLGIRALRILDNDMVNCGIGSAASRPWGVYVVNTSTSRVFEDILIDGNHVEAVLQPVGNAPRASRGIRVTGPGYLRDVVVGSRNTFKNLQRAQRVDFTSATENINVGRIPRIVSTTTQADPVSGQFEPAGERTEYMNPSASTFIGRVTVTAGGAASGTWVANTAYKPGQWVKLSDGKVIEYTVGGTSHASTEPTPSTLMQQYTDGTATYVYRDSASAVFKTYGAISS